MHRHDTTVRTAGALALAVVFAHSPCFAQCGWTTRFAPPGSGGDGMNARIYDMTVFDDGSGAPGQLIAGGDFTVAGATPAPMRVASYAGSGWTALGLGGATNGSVFALAVRPALREQSRGELVPASTSRTPRLPCELDG
jgi:hypothetical protein